MTAAEIAAVTIPVSGAVLGSVTAVCLTVRSAVSRFCSTAGMGAVAGYTATVTLRPPVAPKATPALPEPAAAAPAVPAMPALGAVAAAQRAA